MNTYESTRAHILACVTASSPCALTSVINDCARQGHTIEFFAALHSLVDDGLISCEFESDSLVVDLI